MKWTEAASRGSSIFRISKSLEKTENRIPAMAPIDTAAHGSTVSQEAVMATSPASNPLQTEEVSKR